MSRSTLRIRRALTDVELQHVADLDSVIFPDDSRVKMDGAAWWLVWDGAEPCGFAGASLNQGWGFLRRAGLLRKAQGKGLQVRLIKVRVRWLKEMGQPWCITYTTGDNLRSANNLIKCGFRLYEPQEPWGGSGCLYFRLPLTE